MKQWSLLVKDAKVCMYADKFLSSNFNYQLAKVAVGIKHVWKEMF
jgi:hypothetical protein